MHYEVKSYRACAALLERMLRRLPDKPAYWRQLARIYMTLNNHARARERAAAIGACRAALEKAGGFDGSRKTPARLEHL